MSVFVLIIGFFTLFLYVVFDSNVRGFHPLVL